MPRMSFPSLLPVLRDHFDTYGEINQWVPLLSFGRIVIVYEAAESAEEAKVQWDALTVQLQTEPKESEQAPVVCVYRAEPNPLIDKDQPLSDDHYLRPPAIERNFLISPPGSPPEGWEPIKEDPPNSTPLAADLIAALQKLRLRTNSSSKEMLLEPEDGVGVTVYVEECGEDGYDEDDDDESKWVYGQATPAKLKWAPVPTSMPPMTAA
ncbi:Calcipressin [Athelia psychrophila]|uniref:Calcipressin n=1 Tax=Athelia psychrophila TaxID=1759441 RepID=A0A166CLJ4_9AGAM|nr:Calcipressin [Fibularhizoctonia sp. CBS 109695]